MSHCLIESIPTRKNKIILSDYNYQKDIQNRILMASFTKKDVEVLEEILYSPIQFPLSRLSKNLDLPLSTLQPILEKLSLTGLFFLDKEQLTVDKEKRKYFEGEIQKFSEDFTPGMEFIQNILKKPPIHALPLWYAIPRTSNNIFDSIIEKNLLTPQLFQRYIAELNFGEPILKKIIDELYASPSLELSATIIRQKYRISPELFQEYMLHLEFSFVCCILYKPTDDGWEEYISPFQEWKDYLQFFQHTEISHSLDPQHIAVFREEEFAFVEDLSSLLQAAPFSLSKASLFAHTNPPYFQRLIEKAQLLSLGKTEEGTFSTMEASKYFLSLDKEKQSLYLYRHPSNRVPSVTKHHDIYTEKALREAEKSLYRVVHKGWVRFHDFLEGVIAPISEETTISLRRFGKQWRYTLPKYTMEEKNFFQAVILDWLFEAGLVQIGTLDGENVFKVTELGKMLFAK